MAKQSRPMPDDFADYAPGKSFDALCRHYRAGTGAVRRWLGESGIVPADPRAFRSRAMPENLAELSKVHSIRQLANMLNVHRDTIRRWYREAGLASNCHAPAVLPDDYADLAQRMCQEHLANHYCVSISVIKRWAARAGVRPVSFAPSTLASMGVRHRVTVSGRVKSLYDEAADVLRRERFPVNRCNEAGGFAQDGKFWRVGWSILTGDELLARAAKYERRAA